MKWNDVHRECTHFGHNYLNMVEIGKKRKKATMEKKKKICQVKAEYCYTDANLINSNKVE